MKKYMALAIATAASIAAIVTVSAFTNPGAVAVSVYTVSPQTVRHTVDYTGKVESAENKSIYTDIPCIAGDVLVKTGQLVEKGDVLFTVDVDATKQAAATLEDALPGSSLDEGEIQQEMTSPVRGIVSSLNVSEGEITDSAKPCVVISSGEALQVKISVPESGLSDIFVGQEVTLSGVAFEKDSYRGTISSIAPSARTQASGTASETVVDTIIDIHPEDVDDSLRIGLSAKAQIVLNESPNALIVPYEAVLQDDEGREYVYICQNAIAMKRVITTGNALEDGFEVRAGLKEGEQVILTPEKIEKNGAAVTAT